MKTRYVFFVFMVLYYVRSFFKLNIDSFVNFLSLASLIYSLYFINKIEKTAQGDLELSPKEKIQVIITEILSPVIAGAFYYYTLKKEFPQKARQANLYSWFIVGILAIILLLLRQAGLV